MITLAEFDAFIEKSMFSVIYLSRSDYLGVKVESESLRESRLYVERGILSSHRRSVASNVA